MTGVAAEVGSTANNYQILARLATGGMAEIFLARGVSATGVERYVVLKRILRDRANDVQLVKMFLDEARLAAQLQHPNVAQVYDIGKLGDSYFFTMEYVHGETVRALLHRARSLRRDLPINVILTVIAGAASGLHHAHERLGHDGKPLGIVHRDVSPSNLMTSYEGSVKVVDFGVAKAENRAQETRSGTVKGKIAYLSPEQCRGAPIDRRSDLFSLGIVFWEMLTVERLYKRNSDFDNMTAIVNEDPIPPSARNRTVPPELDRIVLKLLSKDPARRYQSADELVEALENAGPKMGAMISSSSVGRLLREMFGQRPEPWLEMDTTVEVPAEGVTVTSEPVPKELLDGPHAMDALLKQVRDVNVAYSADAPVPVPAAPSQMLTAPAMNAARVEEALRDRVTAATKAELPTRLSTPPRGAPLTQPPATALPTMHGYSTPQQQRASGPLQPLPPPTPVPQAQDANFGPTGSSSGEHAFGAPFAGGSSSSSNIHGYLTGSEATYQPQPKQRSWPLIAIVAGAAVIGSLTVFLAMRGGGGSTPPAEDASIVVTATNDAGSAPEVDTAPEPEVVDAAVAPAVDAAPAKVAVDAAEIKPPSPKQDPLDLAMAESRFKDVVEACARNVPGDKVEVCTIAACKTSQEPKAQKWFARLTNANARKQVAASRESGVDVVPKVTRPTVPTTKPDAGVDKCAVNPMACQR